MISLYDCVEEEELGLFGYVKVSEEWMLNVGEVLQVEETENKYKKRVEKKAMKETLWETKLYRKIMRVVSEVADERSWLRFRAGHLGKNTEGYVFAAQEQALGTKLVLKACS